MPGRLRTCCCVGETCHTDGLQVVLSGLDASLCTDCYPGTARAFKWSSPNVDGVYSVDFFLDSSGACLYTKGGISVIGAITRTRYVDPTDCTSAVDTVVVFDSIGIGVNYTLSSGIIARISASIGVGGAFFYDQVAHGGSYGFGDSIPNFNGTASCGTGGIPFDGGTAVITKL